MNTPGPEGPLFSYPLRPWRNFRIDSGFLDPGYLERQGKNHRGIDLNLITGGDTDLGYPVCSVLPGRVVYAEAVNNSWGGIVVVRADEWVKKMAMDAFERPLSVLDIQYAHLRFVTVQAGDVLNSGDVIGAVGKGGFEQYFAHLHLEVRGSEVSATAAQGVGQDDYEFVKGRYLDPEQMFERLPFSDHPNTLAQRRYFAPSRILSVENPEKGATLIHPVGDKLYLRGL